MIADLNLLFPKSTLLYINQAFALSNIAFHPSNVLLESLKAMDAPSLLIALYLSIWIF